MRHLRCLSWRNAIYLGMGLWRQYKVSISYLKNLAMSSAHARRPCGAGPDWCLPAMALNLLRAFAAHLSCIVVHGIDSIPIWDQALMCLAAAIGCLNTVTLFTWESRSCYGCPETGVLERPDGLGLGYRPNLLGSVCGLGFGTMRKVTPSRLRTFATSANKNPLAS
jgi:hypothetical protein